MTAIIIEFYVIIVIFLFLLLLKLSLVAVGMFLQQSWTASNFWFPFVTPQAGAKL